MKNSLSFGATTNFFTNNVADSIGGDFTSWNVFTLSPNNSGGSDDLLTTDGSGLAEWVSRSEVLGTIGTTDITTANITTANITTGNISRINLPTSTASSGIISTLGTLTQPLPDNPTA